MPDIIFSDTTANQFADSASALVNELCNQSSAREQSANDAMFQFDGAYAKLFMQVCPQEAQDRRKIISKLKDLVEEIQQAIVVAGKERERIKEHAEWEWREENRIHNGLFDSSTVDSSYYDPEPLATAFSPPTLSCSATILDRVRQVSPSSSLSKSSAHPDRLDDFCKTRRNLDCKIEQKKEPFTLAYTKFRSACAWVQLGSFTIVEDLNAYLAENELDAVWVSRIAQAFRDANRFPLDPRSSYVDDLTLGIAAGILKYVRGIYVPVSADVFKAEALQPKTINASVPREIHFGEKFYFNPKRKLYLPDRLDSFPPPDESLTSAKNVKTKAFLSKSTEVGINVRWAKAGGRALGAIGAGITLWSNYSEAYSEKSVAHPELSSSEVQLRAVEQMATVSTVEISASIAGSVGGAKLGAMIGGGIGSVVPGAGTAIGAAVGGVIGAVGGVIAGSFLGHSAGKAVSDGIFGR